MIWIYENLKPPISDKILKLEPFVHLDFGKDDESQQAVFYITCCAGHEIRNGRLEEIRKIQFFGLEDVKQGFICDDIDETRKLCMFMKNDIQLDMFSNWISNVTEVVDYLKTEDWFWVRHIAVPVCVYIEYYKEVNPKMLDMLDLNLLKKWKIDIYDYIERGEIWT